MNKEITIVGAGATGLSAALFLAAHGYKPRIIEKRAKPSSITKALGVNPNTLTLLEHSGLTERFLQNGWKSSCMNIWHRHTLVYKNDLSKVKHKYPFMLIQPQCDTEHMLEERLAAYKIFVERGIDVTDISALAGQTTLKVEAAGGSAASITTNGIVIAADGSKSRIREQLNIDFKGWEHKEEFRMCDVELTTDLSPNESHYFFFKEGGFLMLHIRNGIWRVGGNVTGNILDYLPPSTRAGHISWETTFTVQEKVAAQFSRNNVYLLGDAAHIHSPAGARGMNLCIEDAHIFATLLAEGREKEYHTLRHKKIQQTVSSLGNMTDRLVGHNMLAGIVRANLKPLSYFFPIVMPGVRKLMLGL